MKVVKLIKELSTLKLKLTTLTISGGANSNSLTTVSVFKGLKLLRCFGFGLMKILKVLSGFDGFDL